jgi:cobalt-zinc-cadmium efflux system outer membrane protein
LIGSLVPLLLMSQAARGQDLTLADALARVASGDPTVAVNAARADAANAAVLQAGIRPRDVIGVDIEDFAGTGPYSPLEQSQTTAWYERTLERGGKREARVAAARSEFGVAEQQGRLRLLDVLARVQAAWVEALAAQAAIPVAEERLADARQVQAEVDRRVARALDPLFAGERARTAVAQALIALDQAQQTARTARRHLGAYWGGAGDFRLDPVYFDRLDLGAGTPEGSPDLALLAAQRDAATARAKLAETGNVGDPSLRAGIRHFGRGNDLALMVGGSIPIGNRAANRGALANAHAEQLAAEAEIAVARVEREREIDRLLAERATIASEIYRIDREVLPSARRAVVLVRDGLRRGGTAFTFLEASQAQQAVIEIRSRRVALLHRFHLAGVRLDRLTGRHIPLIANTETP